VDELCVTSSWTTSCATTAAPALLETMSSAFGEDVGRFGLEIGRVSSAELHGDEYEDFAEKLGEVDISGASWNTPRTCRELNKETMSQIRTLTSCWVRGAGAHVYGISHAQSRAGADGHDARIRHQNVWTNCAPP
jgi:hypothetical protein